VERPAKPWAGAYRTKKKERKKEKTGRLIGVCLSQVITEKL